MQLELLVLASSLVACATPRSEPPTSADREGAHLAIAAAFGHDRRLAAQIGDFDLALCWPPERLDDIRPVRVDSVSLRYRASASAPVELLAGWGTPCGRARDAEACRRALAAQPIEPPLVPRGILQKRFDEAMDLVTTAGDVVGRVASVPDLQALLGSVDTPCEAALLLYTRIGDLRGQGPRARAARKDVRGYLILGSYGDGCEDDRFLHLWEVSSGGSVLRGDTFLADAADGPSSRGAPCQAP